MGWYVFGAQAVAVRGVARATQDVDVTLSAVPDVDRLLVSLHANGFRHRFPDIAAELLRDGAVLPMVHAGGMEADLVLGGTEIEELAAARATLERVDGARVPVAAAVDLVISKLIAGRPRDLEDVRGVLAVNPVDMDEVRAVLEALDRALGTTEFSARLDDLARPASR